MAKVNIYMSLNNLKKCFCSYFLIRSPIHCESDLYYPIFMHTNLLKTIAEVLCLILELRQLWFWWGPVTSSRAYSYQVEEQRWEPRPADSDPASPARLPTRALICKVPFWGTGRWSSAADTVPQRHRCLLLPQCPALSNWKVLVNDWFFHWIGNG